MKRFFQLYADSYRGISQPAWMLAVIMLINRSGAMVLPFLGVYMTDALNFSLKDTGTVLSFFGLGAVLGSSLGGRLTDKIGHFKVQLISLLLSVPLFFLLPLYHTPLSLSFGIFFLSFVTETFRPANSVSITSYAKPENITRAFSLNRMALNLGFSIGPALGGILAAISYQLLFFGNGVSAGLAGIVFYFYFRNRKGNKYSPKHKNENDHAQTGVSPYKHKKFLIFSFLCCLYAICFFQLLSTLPLFYKEIHQLSKGGIGLLLAFSGLVVFALEMFLVQIAERRLTSNQTIVLGSFLCGLSFLLLLIEGGHFVLYSAMFVLCVSEILAMPFMATITVKIAPVARQGAYMGMNALAFSLAHIFSPYLGTRIAENYGFPVLWIGTGILSVITTIGFWLVLKKMK